MEKSDYIRKVDAIDEVNHALDRETILFSFVRKVAISALKKMPSADVVQVRHGRWIDDGTEFGCQCSECGKTLDDYVAPTEYASLNEIPNFCPNCGAKMDAKGEE